MRRAALLLVLLASCTHWRPPVQEAELRTPDEWETVSDRRAWQLITGDVSYAQYGVDPEQLRPVRGPRRFVLPTKNALVIIYPDRPATVTKLDPRRPIDPLSPRELEIVYASLAYQIYEDLRDVPRPQREGPPPPLEEEADGPR